MNNGAVTDFRWLYEVLGLRWVSADNGFYGLLRTGFDRYLMSAESTHTRRIVGSIDSLKRGDQSARANLNHMLHSSHLRSYA